MTSVLTGTGQIGIAFVTAFGFAGSTWAFKMALDTQDFRWMTGAFGTLILSYIPYLALLGQSMSGTIVVTSMISQMLALAIAFAIYGEPITPFRALGLAAALIAVLAFAMPTPGKF